jgi:hypothetical protein
MASRNRRKIVKPGAINQRLDTKIGLELQRELDCIQKTQANKPDSGHKIWRTGLIRIFGMSQG